jgi:hypothetical protein
MTAPKGRPVRRCRSTELSDGRGVQCTLPAGHKGMHKHQRGDPEAWWPSRQKRLEWAGSSG